VTCHQFSGAKRWVLGWKPLQK